MDSKFRFDPLGTTSSARRNSGAFNVIWVEGDINLGVVRKIPQSKQWSGIYAWTYPSPTLDSKNAVADWMLVQYMTRHKVDTTV
jgi:hypothetical protein